MMYKCAVCGYIYNPETGEPRNGTSPGTAFEELPDKWFCPKCGAGKIRFRITNKPW
jgi:rubredoxin